MARIPYPDPATLPADDRDFLASLPQLNISRLLAGSPSMFQPLTQVFSAYLNDGVLTPEMREIVILRVGHRRSSEYEVENHQRAARVVGMSAKRIAALKPGGDLNLFTADERCVIQFVDEVMESGRPGDETFQAVGVFMNTAQLVELSVVIGVYTMVSQICATFDIELEDVPIADTGMEDIGKAVRRLSPGDA
jgi:4-carboxymuconolactone decarboxylase